MARRKALTIAISSGAVAGGDQSIALGFNAKAGDGGEFADVAIGSSAVADGPRAVALGEGTTAQGNRATAVGGESSAAANSVAIGPNADASGSPSVAIGLNTVANAQSTVAIGIASIAGVGNSVAIGVAAMADSQSGIAMGNGATASGDFNPIAIGPQATASNINSIAMGKDASSGGFGSVALGTGASARNDFIMVLGGPASDGDKYSLTNPPLNVGIGTNAPSSQAALELAGNLGLILNRVDLSSAAIGEEGMIVYDTDDARVEFYDDMWNPIGEQTLTLEDDKLILSQVSQPENVLSEVPVADICNACDSLASPDTSIIQASAIGNCDAIANVDASLLEGKKSGDMSLSGEKKGGFMDVTCEADVFFVAAQGGISSLLIPNC
jgi:hypothetical protein